MGGLVFLEKKEKRFFCPGGFAGANFTMVNHDDSDNSRLETMQCFVAMVGAVSNCIGPPLG